MIVSVIMIDLPASPTVSKPGAKQLYLSRKSSNSVLGPFFEFYACSKSDMRVRY